MGDRIPPPAHLQQYSQSPVHSAPHHLHLNSMRYVAELLAERQKLAPFVQVLPYCTRLLNQEILRASSLPPNHNFVDAERIEHGSPLRLPGHPVNGQPMDLEGWSGRQAEHMGVLQASPMSWNGAPALGGTPVVKKLVRLDVPVDKYPNFNFVGRLLGPRGNSLKRVEATTQCRVYIRGRGSVKDSVKCYGVTLGHEMPRSLVIDFALGFLEEKLRDKPGYEHLNEALHVLVEAEFPADIIDVRLNQAVTILEDLLKPMDESMDYYKKQQLRELAILNGTLREESPSPHLSPSISPFNSAGMKRPKTGR
ncbi:hypothetical protein TRIUR3_13157 [Triticum urartu]|uniref:STAR protein homodimerisation region domain-containing protein n=2 Tax=Triticum TaxID=4564 RepID=A0A9R0VQ22_TRITD|nr:hypothetical protein TRIUR3_13157 [Triticum urartu]VAH67144.1 unnamed protein product [Triticum turgidum subsp. durum]